jgi:hypothetical protein
MKIAESQIYIEHWLVTGSISPFQIISFTRDAVEPDGTFGKTEVSD